MKERDIGRVLSVAVAALISGGAMTGCSGPAKKPSDAGGPGMVKGDKNGCKEQGGCSGDDGGAKTAMRHSCKGQNACKGQGGCKAGDNGCAGKNSCKGKGGCAVPAAKR